MEIADAILRYKRKEFLKLAQEAYKLAKQDEANGRMSMTSFEDAPDENVKAPDYLYTTEGWDDQRMTLRD